jgi:hypothetical protein
MWDLTAQPSQFHTYDEITADALRAPESILQGPLDEKVDIWAFRCMARLLFSSIRFFSHTSDWIYLQILLLVTLNAHFSVFNHIRDPT